MYGKVRRFEKAGNRTEDHPELIVSMTSFPARIPTISKVLKSLYTQSRKPDRILLWLAEEEFPRRENDLPEELLRDVRRGRVDLRWCENLGSHKKYFYTMQEYPEDIIITVDDDKIYRPKMIETLYSSYLKHPRAISANRVSLMTFDRDGKLLPPDQWVLDFRVMKDIPSMQLMAIGSGGILYPPGSHDERIFARETIERVCRAEDLLFLNDAWLKANEVLRGIPVVCTGADDSDCTIAEAQSVARKSDPAAADVMHKKEKSLWDELQNLFSGAQGLSSKLELIRSAPGAWTSKENAVLKNAGPRFRTVVKKVHSGEYGTATWLLRHTILELNQLKAQGRAEEKLSRYIPVYRKILKKIRGSRGFRHNLSLDALITHGLIISAGIPTAQFRTPGCYQSMLSSWEDYFRNNRSPEKLYRDGYLQFLAEAREAGVTPVPRVSVIIPVYNAASYLEKCLSSICDQSMVQWEALIFDDCSTDESLSILRRYEAADPRIHVFVNEKNLGPGGSRNRGIALAKGDYLSFVDADDWLDKDFYKALIERADADGAKIVKAHTEFHHESDVNMSRSDARGVFRNPELKDKPLYYRFTYEHYSAIYERSLFCDPAVRYGDGRMGEDALFLLRICFASPRFSLVDRVLYHYRVRAGSLSNTVTPQNVMLTLDSLENKIAFLKERHCLEKDTRLISRFIRFPLKIYHNTFGGDSPCVCHEEEKHECACRFKTIVDSLPGREEIIRDHPQLKSVLAEAEWLAPASAPEVSVILPLYNCEKYLPKLFAELEAQSLSDYEVICVDDGSTDGTAGAVLTQCTKDERYSALTIPHGGAGAARNAGLAHAVGKYVIWLDADDDYQPDLLKALVSEADQTAADITMCLYEEINFATGIKMDTLAFNTRSLPPGAVINPPSARLSYYDYGVGITNKLYRRQFVFQEGLRFSEIFVANDVFFNYASVSAAKRVASVHKNLITVNRYLNADSISSRRSEHLEDVLTAYRELWAFLENRKLDEIYKERYCKRVIADALYNLQYPYNEKFVAGLTAFFCTERPWISYSKETAAEKFWQHHNTKAVASQIRKLQKDMADGAVDPADARQRLIFLENKRQALEAMERIAKEKYGKTIFTSTRTYMPKKIARKVLAKTAAELHKIKNKVISDN